MRTKNDTALPAHVRWNTNRHGTRKLVYKKGRHGPLTTFRCQQPGSEEFWKEYHRIGAGIAGQVVQITSEPRLHHYAIKFKVLCERYLASPEFSRLMRETQYNQRWGLNAMMECVVPEQDKPKAEWHRLGEWGLDAIDIERIRAARHNIAPPQLKCRTGNSDARIDKMIAQTKVVFTWARLNGWPKLVSPCAGIDRLASKSPGALAWNDTHVGQWIATHRKGSVPYLALCLMRFLGVRGCDVARLGKGNLVEVMDPETGRPVSMLTFTEYKNSTSRNRKTKTKQQVYPIAPELWEAIEATPGALMRETFIVNERMTPITRASNFGQTFRAWRKQAGLPVHLTAHGLRKFTAIDAAHKGFSASTLKAILGHSQLQQSAWYVEQAETLGLLTRVVSTMRLPKPVRHLKVVA